MGSYETIVKLEEMRRRVEEGDLLSALKILETLELKKIKNMSDLNLIAEVYAENQRYEEAQDLYHKIYEKTKSRKSLYQLIEMLVKLNNSEDAEYFMKQYQKLAPKDFYNYVFRYKIDKMKGESYEHLIEILGDLKNSEYTEKWAYELAKLYYKAGMEAECIRECSDIILWFGEGTYVEKAKILRSYYSGETDKDQIMEEIKRRAEVVSSQAEQNIQSEEKEEEQLEDAPGADASYELEDGLYNHTDFMLNEDTADFENGLKKDIQNILTDENEPPYQDENTYYEEEETSDSKNNVFYPEEKTYYEEDSEISPDLKAFSNNTEEADAAAVYDADINQEEEQSKKDEDQTASNLHEEVYYDEDDKRLIQMAGELMINPDEVFGNFLHVLSVKKQLVKSLEIITNERSKNVMMIITGAKGSGKTALAKDMALLLFKAGILKSSKVAKIKAEKLNTVDIMAKKDTLKDCCMVVEEASELKRQTIDGLLELSRYLQGNIAYIFEEDKKNMNKLFRECPKLMDIKNRIHLPQYTLEELIGFAYACLKQKDYRLNSNAELTLKNKVGQIAKQSDSRMYLEKIFEMMQSAMNATDIRTGKELSNLATRGRLQDVDILTILPEDLQ